MFKSRYIPQGAVKVSDKLSDAVAYAYTDARGRPAVLVYYGTQSKAAYHYGCRNEAERESLVKRAFVARQEYAARKQKDAADRKAAGPGLAVGDIVGTCWGYDQTNREFYQVLSVKGKTVELRQIGTERTGDWAGKCVPQTGDFIGEPFRKLARNGSVNIDGHYATKWNTGVVAGVAVGPAVYWSAYA